MMHTARDSSEPVTLHIRFGSRGAGTGGDADALW